MSARYDLLCGENSMIFSSAVRRFSSETSLTARTAPSLAKAVATERPIPRGPGNEDDPPFKTSALRVHAADG